ncbi:MAG: hypothetical protein HFI89_02530 [Lachnospiraceae bacterium]|nr:hypothetical protein [Lachnospiraceae bacterium]
MSYMGIGEIEKKDFEFLDVLFKEYIPSYNEIWLFGTGKYAMAFTRFLKICDIDIAGYVVSDKNTISIKEKNVLSIEEFKEYKKKKNGEGVKIALLLAVHNQYYGEIYPYIMSLGKDVCFIKRSYLDFAKEHCGKVDNIILSVVLTEFCRGILCYGCTSAVPIVKENCLYEARQFFIDIDKIYDLIGSKVECINFTGGDVFLHPQLIEIVEYTRKLFKTQLINFSINGILLSEQSEEFWSRLAKCNVELNWTLYPIEYSDLEETINVIKKVGGIKLNINGDGGGEEKNSWKIPYTLKKQNKYDWLFCRHHKCSKNVLMMYENTLGVCHAYRGLNHLEKAFGYKFTAEFKRALMKFHGEVLKVDEIKNNEEIFDYMKIRPSICDYCALRERKNMGQWMRSKGDFEEWFV